MVAHELGADCLAGYFLGWLHCGGMLSPADVQAAFGAACNSGDAWFAPASHGSCSDRVAAVTAGMNGYANQADPLSTCDF